jgi:hypothetical protein
MRPANTLDFTIGRFDQKVTYPLSASFFGDCHLRQFKHLAAFVYQCNRANDRTIFDRKKYLSARFDDVVNRIVEHFAIMVFDHKILFDPLIIESGKIVAVSRLKLYYLDIIFVDGIRNISAPASIKWASGSL